MTDGPRILIVDDEPNIRDLLTTSLRFAGFAVRALVGNATVIAAALPTKPRAAPSRLTGGREGLPAGLQTWGFARSRSQHSGYAQKTRRDLSHD